MAEILKMTLLSPERRLFDGLEVSSVTLTGSEGQIQILPGHAAMIGTLDTGTFRFTSLKDGQELGGVISSGFFEVKDDTLKVMAETLELRKDIDLSRAKTAQQKAEAALQQSDLDEAQFKKYQLKLQRSLVRQQVAAKGAE